MKKLIALIVVAAVLGLAAVVAANTFELRSQQLRVAPAEPIAVDVERAAARLAGAIRFPTISNQDASQFRGAPFRALHAYLAERFPRLGRSLVREVVNDFSLLYAWRGSEPERKPVLLLAHLDVVPVPPASRPQWSRDPFAGAVAEGFVWGRGALDDKVSALAMLEAVEALLAEGFEPARNVYLAFGHDEEVGGRDGAARIAQLLDERGLRFAYTLDEGLIITSGLMPGVRSPVALVGIAEKGYVSVELIARGEGGHSSMPPPRTAAGRLAAAVDRLEGRPMAARIDGPTAAMFDFVAPEMKLPLQAVFANRWLFDPLIRFQLAKAPATNALMRTTTATTMLRAGVKENVLPTEARAIVNFRILPGESIAAVRAHVRDTVDDPAVEVRVLPGDEPSPVSDPGAPSFGALHKTIRAVFPDVVVAPGLMIAGSDSKHYAALAEASYRFLPLRLEPADLARIHGVDERIAIRNYVEIIRFYVELLRNTAS